MLAVLASGTLTRDPQRRRSAQGKDYATALLRTPSEDAEAMLVSLIAFADSVVEALLALKQGDAVAIAGRAKLTTWVKDGKERHDVSITADRVMSTYEIGQKRKAARAEVGASDERPV